MKFLKKLGSFLSALLLMAVLAGIVWFAFGDYLKIQFVNLKDMLVNMEENAETDARTADMRQVLETAFSHFSSQTLIGCNTYEECAGEKGTVTETAWDRETDLVRQSFPVVGYRSITIQDAYNPDNYLSNTWTCFAAEEADTQVGEISYCRNKDWTDSAILEADANTWYHYDTLC